MYKLHMLNAPAGAGKTFGLIQKCGELMGRGDSVILSQPTKELIRQTVIDVTARYPNIKIVEMHGDTHNRVVSEIIDYLFNPYPEPHLLIITQTSLERIAAVPFNKHDWHLLIDEIPKVEQCLEKIVPVNHRILTEHLTLTSGPGGVYGSLSVSNENQLDAIASNKSDDAVWGVFKDMVHVLLSPRWECFVDADAYSNLLNGSGIDKKLTIFSLLQPSIFQDFKSVTIAGANFEDSLLFKLWSKKGIEFVQVTELPLRYHQHTNGKELTICWAIDRMWSKRLYNAGNGRVIKLMEDAAHTEFGDADFLYARNKDYEPFQGVPNARAIPFKPDGLNELKEYVNIAFLSARNLTPAYGTFLELKCNLTIDEIQTAIHRQAVYQAVMRGALREPGNDRTKRVFVPDLRTAEWLQSLFPGSQLVKLKTSFEEEVPELKRGRKRLHSSNAEKAKAFRQNRKEQKQNDLEKLLMPEPLNEAGLLKINQLGFRNDIPNINSNNVTNFKLSLFENIRSVEPFGTIILETHEEFEDLMKDCSKTRIVKEKDKNVLMSPSAFDREMSSRTKRGEENVMFATGIILDFDGGSLSPKQLSDIFPTLRMMVMSTFSSVKSKLRFRVYVPTATTMTASQYEVVVKALLKEIEANGFVEKSGPGNRKTHGIDMSKVGAQCLFYLPCIPKDPLGSYFKVFKGKDRQPLDPYEWIAAFISQQEATPFIQMPIEDVSFGTASVSEVDEGRVERAIQWWQGVARTPEKDNGNFFSLALRLHGAGCQLWQIEQHLLTQSHWANTPGDRQRQIPSILNSMKRYALTGSR